MPHVLTRAFEALVAPVVSPIVVLLTGRAPTPKVYAAPPVLGPPPGPEPTWFWQVWKVKWTYQGSDFWEDSPIFQGVLSEPGFCLWVSQNVDTSLAGPKLDVRAFSQNGTTLVGQWIGHVTSVLSDLGCGAYGVGPGAKVGGARVGAWPWEAEFWGSSEKVTDSEYVDPSGGGPSELDPVKQAAAVSLQAETSAVATAQAWESGMPDAHSYIANWWTVAQSAAEQINTLTTQYLAQQVAEGKLVLNGASYKAAQNTLDPPLGNWPASMGSPQKRSYERSVWYKSFAKQHASAAASKTGGPTFSGPLGRPTPPTFSGPLGRSSPWRGI